MCRDADTRSPKVAFEQEADVRQAAGSHPLNLLQVGVRNRPGDQVRHRLALDNCVKDETAQEAE